MPFKKIGTNKYKGPTGKVFDYAQVRLYYANGGKFPGQKGKSGKSNTRNKVSKRRK